MDRHDIRDFMSEMTREISAEYQRLRERSKEDPGTAGGQGEETWARLLRSWLPAGYHVVTGGRIIDSKGETSPQVDVVVLDPSYPPGLLRLKYYLAPAVVAAFECKLSVTSAHIAKSVRTAALLERMMTDEGRRAGEFLYGLLAHSHTWRSLKSKPARSITNALDNANADVVHLPGEFIDVLCVADLYTWVGECVLIDDDVIEYGHFGPISGVFDDASPDTGDPVARMIAHILGRIGRNVNGIDQIAGYLHRIGAYGEGVGKTRNWMGLAKYQIPAYCTDNGLKKSAGH
ncbi:DUF6602 domain-containing protein [Streptomyces malaysiensis]|uniref:DUF6602 domain-containing protein n=1 Tax=Streptomyces malaysiensis TaxID=92644 RepID=UPI00341250E7